MENKIELGLKVRDEVYEGNPFSEISEIKKVLEILVNAIDENSLNDEEKQIFNKFKDNRYKVKELTNGNSN